MSDPIAVFVVPAPGDPGGLLAPGSCNSAPPFVWRQSADPVCRQCGATARWSSAPTEQSDSCWVCSDEWRHDGIEFRTWTPWTNGYHPRRNRGGEQHALPLWWDGAVVPEGWDRARRVWDGGEDYVALQWLPALALVMRHAREMVDLGLASRVVLLDRPSR